MLTMRNNKQTPWGAADIDPEKMIMRNVLKMKKGKHIIIPYSMRDVF